MPEGVYLHANFEALAEAYSNGDKVLRRHVGATLRTIAKPLGEEVVREGADDLPARGGLRARVKNGAKVGVTARLTGSTPQVSLRLQNRDGYQLAGMNAGIIRHPTFDRAGRTRTWVSQRIAPGAFTHPFDAKANEAQTKLLRSVQVALGEIGRDASH